MFSVERCGCGGVGITTGVVPRDTFIQATPTGSPAQPFCRPPGVPWLAVGAIPIPAGDGAGVGPGHHKPTSRAFGADAATGDHPRPLKASDIRRPGCCMDVPVPWQGGRWHHEEEEGERQHQGATDGHGESAANTALHHYLIIVEYRTNDLRAKERSFRISNLHGARPNGSV